MNDNHLELMREASRLTRAGHVNEATLLIQRALGIAAPASPAPAAGPVANPVADASLVLDGCVFEVESEVESEVERDGAGEIVSEVKAARAADAPLRPVDPPPVVTDAAPQPARFTEGTHTHATLTRRYKLYVPEGASGSPRPLVVMLHGCTQDPDDFAAGTAMNERAREQGFLVLYPAQSQEANPQRCWNWFKPNHQQRGSGEPALIASLTQAVMAHHHVDPRRVYIAGLSAGGAMAAIVGAAYPDLFAAVGVHSGLPQGAARDVAGALAVMKSGVAAPASAARAGLAGSAASTPPLGSAPPTIVFHGDEDATVHPRNGDQVVAAALGSGRQSGLARAAAASEVAQATAAQGRRYTRSVYRRGGDLDAGAAEHWLVHGAGHAWSGGSARGSFTDPRGPDASREMLRFFFAHPHAARE